MIGIEEDLHIAAFIIASREDEYLLELLESPTNFIADSRRVKQRPYAIARHIFKVLGHPVPEDFRTPGSGHPQHMMGRFQEVWREMKRGDHS